MGQVPSRYADVPHLTYVTPQGKTIVYYAQRFLPQGNTLPLRQVVQVKQSEQGRLDLVTARTLGPSELFWRVAEANNGMNPFALVARPGRSLRIPGSS